MGQAAFPARQKYTGTDHGKDKDGKGSQFEVIFRFDTLYQCHGKHDKVASDMGRKHTVHVNKCGRVAKTGDNGE